MEQQAEQSSQPNATQGAVALLTGTSSGFGLLASVELAKAGYDVVATMRDPGKQNALLEAARVAGVVERIHVKSIDVTDEDQIARTVGEVLAEFGRIDVLVNNAGYAQGGFIEEMAMAEWRAQFETNFFGLIACTKAVLPHMRSRRRGTIINISSISGRIGLPGMGPYVASKFAVEGYSECLRLEMAKFGVRVVMIEPGPYRTNVWEKGLSDVAVDEHSPYKAETEKLARMAKHSAEHAGDPLEVAHAILHVLRQSAPKLRYPVGRGMKLAVAAKNFIPWRQFEKTVTKRM